MTQDQLTHFLTDKADDMKAESMTILDVKGKSSITDTMIICSGTSKRHVSAIAENVALEAKRAGLDVWGMEGEDQGDWVVVDLGNVIMHIMQDDARELYQLEKLWG